MKKAEEPIRVEIGPGRRRDVTIRMQVLVEERIYAESERGYENLDQAFRATKEHAAEFVDLNVGKILADLTPDRLEKMVQEVE